MKKKLKEAIRKALSELGVPARGEYTDEGSDNIHLEHPADVSHGDYATNAALVYTKDGEVQTLADALADKLIGMDIDYVADIAVAGPGFINFTLSKDFYTHTVEKILKEEERYGRGKMLSGERVMIEYTDPNPFKEFHIGHLMPNVIGEALSRLYEWNGAEVRRANYQGDVGLHVAKALWGMKEIDDEMPAESNSLESKAAFLGRAYAFGAEAYGESEHVRKAVQEINIRIYKKTDEKLNNLYQWGRKTSLEYFETLYKRLGTAFDFYFFESETADIGKKIVRKHLGKVFEESEGAYIYRGEKHGLHTRVFLTKDGLPTYEAKDLALARLKYQKYPYEKSIIITGQEQEEYFKVMLSAMRETDPVLAEKTEHISLGMMRLASGKMSSRTGDAIPAQKLLDNVYERAYERVKNDDAPKEEKHTIADRLSVGAIKYSILRQGIGRDVTFDKEKALSLEGDSGPYLEYSYVRTQSIKTKAAEEGVEADARGKRGAVNDVERLLYRFPEVVENAVGEHAPQVLVTYLTNLASAFNSYYAEATIVDPDEEESPYRLALTEAVGTVLKNGMHVLGFEAPERM